MPLHQLNTPDRSSHVTPFGNDSRDEQQSKSRHTNETKMVAGKCKTWGVRSCVLVSMSRASYSVGTDSRPDLKPNANYLPFMFTVPSVSSH